MKFSDIRGMSVEELKKKITGLRGELFESKMKNMMGQLGNPLSIRGVRRDIARIETALKEKLSR